MHPGEDVVLGRMRIRHFRYRKPIDTGSAFTRDDRLHVFSARVGERGDAAKNRARDLLSSSIVIVSTPAAQMHTASNRLQPVASKLLI